MKLVIASSRPRPHKKNRPFRPHVETFISAASGESLHLSCFCQSGENHLTLPGARQSVPSPSVDRSCESQK
ncbi:hypothetical protein FB463_002539 [Frigoribacterium faeni]|uniref:Uncharacterized protein n=1 Tax=Frigoribacterium faeni TaxID=145483 RepID=A0A7W3PJQ4_9MICO|nr:hypothetical protein [Frigoribacterium faeni]